MSHPRLAIAAVTFALLVDEILLSSIFHVLLGEGGTLSAISVALLGLSASGVAVYLLPALQREKAPLLAFSLALMASAYAVMAVPISHVEVAMGRGDAGVLAWRLLVHLIATLPFFLGGLVINALLLRHRQEVSRLYAADLAGAALGCAASPLLLTLAGAPRGIVLAAVPAVLIALAGRRGLQPLIPAALPAVLLAVLLAGSFHPELLRFRELNTMGEVRQPQPRVFPIRSGDVEYEKWALDAWTIVRSERIPQQWERFQGWGLSERYRGPVPPVRLINFNARFSTYVTRYDGDPAAIGEWLDADLISLHYLLGRRYGSVLNIGAGGGREVLNGLRHGARRIVAVDVSEVVVNDLMRGRLREFSGGLFFDPRVEARADEGRSFTERTAERFDLIDFSIVGGMNLEKMDLVRVDDLFTREALGTYLDRLTEEGVFSYVMYTLRSDLVDGIAARRDTLTALPYVPALKTLTGLRMAFEERFPGRDFRAHVLIAGLPGVINPGYDLAHIMVSRKPFLQAERERFRERCAALGFTAFYPAPGSGGLYSRVIEAPDLDRLAVSLPFSIRPATDDKPFHFGFDGVHLLRALRQGSLARFLAGNPLISLGATLGLLALLIVAAPLAILSLRGGEPLAEARSHWRLLLLFACLGYGYMAVEIAVLFKLQLYLGKPVYGLSVGLFSFLLASGLGSRATARLEGDGLRHAVYRNALLLAALGLAFLAVSAPLFARTLAQPLAVRILIAAGVIFPFAFVMGTFFPIAVKLVSLVSRQGPALIPWAYAVNGCLSVAGIWTARTLALFLGFNRALLSGLLCYLLAAACVRAARGRRASSEKRALLAPSQDRPEHSFRSNA